MYCDLFIVSFTCLNRLRYHAIEYYQMAHEKLMMIFLTSADLNDTGFYEIFVHLIMYVFHYIQFNFTFIEVFEEMAIFFAQSKDWGQRYYGPT